MAHLADMLVNDVMRRWPDTIPVFIRHRMRCVGCPIAIFHTVSESCSEHQQSVPDFLAALETSIDQALPSASSTS